MKILIFGSCVSRDIFNHDKSKQFEVIDYYARSSWSVLSCDPYQNDDVLVRVLSPFQRRMVDRDFSREILDAAVLASADIILIDLIDERFDLLLMLSGQLVTASSELLSTGFLKSELVIRAIPPGTHERRALWLVGVKRFLSSLCDKGLLSKVVVNKVFWAHRFDSDSAVKFPTDLNVVEAANQELEWMYEMLGHWLVATQFLDFEADLMVANADHRWGPQPFHFIEKYYCTALNKLAYKQTQLLLMQETTIAPQNNQPNFRQIGAGSGSMVSSNSYDISAWNLPIHTHLNIETALVSGLTDDGIYQIGLGSGQTLDLCIQGLAGLEAQDAPQVLLVGFSGAVAARDGKKAPFFSGLSIAKSLGLPIVAVSDPTLALDKQLPLAWYAGNEAVLDLPVRIARVLDHIARQHRAHLLLFGGSGGGFAALLQATLLEVETTVLVWNPQTAIAEYAPQFVTQFIKAAFSGLDEMVDSVRADATAKQSERLREVLDLTTIKHDTRDLKLPSHVNLLYLQNQSDWHVARHAVPYLANKSLRRMGQAAFLEKVNNQLGVFLGHWGQGHVAPPQEMLEALLRKLAAGETIVEVVQALNEGLGGLGEAPPHVHWFAADPDIQLIAKAWVADAHIHATCSVGPETNAGRDVTYAFYLLVNGVRQALRWYESKNNAFFDLPDVKGRLEVIAFARDSLGGQLNVRISVEMAGGERNTAL